MLCQIWLDIRSSTAVFSRSAHTFGLRAQANLLAYFHTGLVRVRRSKVWDHQVENCSEGPLQRYLRSRQPHSSRPFHDLTGTIPLFHHSTGKMSHRLWMGAASRNGLWGVCLPAAFWERAVAKELAALWIALLISNARAKFASNKISTIFNQRFSIQRAVSMSYHDRLIFTV